MFPKEFVDCPIFQAVWENTMEMIVFSDSDRKIVALNDSALEKFGYEMSELHGLSSEVLYHGRGEFDVVGKRLKRSTCGRQLETYKAFYKKKDGSIFRGKTRAMNVCHSDGRSLGYVVIIYDQTEVDKFERMQRTQKGYLERMGKLAKVGYWRINLEDENFIWSDVLYDIAGVKKNEFNLKWPESVNVLHPDDVDRVTDNIRHAGETGKEFSTEARVVRPNGDLRYITLEGEGELDPETNKVISVFGSCVDITDLRLKEEELFETKRLRDFVMDTIPIRVFWKDLESNYLGCNQKFADDAALERPELIEGKTDFDLFGEESAEAFRMDDREVMISGRPKMFFEETQIREDGSVNWLQTNKIPLKNLAQETIGVVGTYEDITLRKLREQRFALSHYCVEQVKSAVFWCNPDGSFFYVNETACKWLGYSKKEMMTMHVADINPEFPRETWSAHWENIKSSKMTHLESFHQRKNGEVYPVEMYSNYVTHEEHEFKISFVFDISERREAEEKLKEYSENLEGLVEQRTIALKEMNEELESFAYSVSHDLRAPLRGIDGFGQALIEDYGNKLGDSGKHYLNRIRLATQKMSSLIDDILNLSKVSRLEVRHEAVGINDLAQSILDDLKHNDPGRHVSLIQDKDMVIWGDPKLLKIALFNLIGNAWKYSAKVEQAEISLRLEEDESSQCLSIKDNGAGFDMQYAAKLFSPFQRLHRQDEFDGNGIGLATVKRVVGKHGGIIRANSAVGEGATFHITLPKRN